MISTHTFIPIEESTGKFQTHTKNRSQCKPVDRDEIGTEQAKW